MANVLIYCIESEACRYFAERKLPASNGTDALLAWQHESRLQRHIQRVLAERHLAAAALASSGLDVLLTDVTAVIVRDVSPFFGSLPAEADMAAIRGGCKPKEKLGCSLDWNFLFLRGSSSRRSRLVRYVQDALNVGMVDFYLRWWAGTHCIFMGYSKLFGSSGPTLAGGLSPEENGARPNQTALISLRAQRGESASVTLAMLPSDRFPRAGTYTAARDTALVGRSLRPFFGHRLRLDRYDERDFTSLREAMVADGLWRHPL